MKRRRSPWSRRVCWRVRLRPCLGFNAIGCRFRSFGLRRDLLPFKLSGSWERRSRLGALCPGQSCLWRCIATGLGVSYGLRRRTALACSFRAGCFCRDLGQHTSERGCARRLAGSRRLRTRGRRNGRSIGNSRRGHYGLNGHGCTKWHPPGQMLPVEMERLIAPPMLSGRRFPGGVAKLCRSRTSCLTVLSSPELLF